MSLENKIDIPLIQGGMGVGISLASLAGHVAKCGGIGTISAADIGYSRADFFETPQKANEIALREEVKKAKTISGGRGLIAVNIMYATAEYEDTVECAIEAGADIIVSGAGLPLNLAELNRKRVMIAPVVSSLRALKIIIKRWMKQKTLPDFVIVEGPLAGGHLGFKDLNAQPLEEISKDIVDYLAEEGLNIKVFAAGGIRSKSDFERLQRLGVFGIQIATPFIATEECDAHEHFKEAIVSSTDEDLKLIHSPVGMPARAIQNDFLNRLIVNGTLKRRQRCIRCLKTCDGKSMDFCISEQLIDACLGKGGLVFSGAHIDGIDEIRTVKEVIGDFI